jgi:hypothetical protein
VLSLLVHLFGFRLRGLEGDVALDLGQDLLPQLDGIDPFLSHQSGIRGDA